MKEVIKGLAVVHGGGGLRGAWSAGAHAAMQKHWDIKNPEFMIGRSAGAFNAAYMSSGQIEESKEIWTRRILGERYINKRRIHRILDNQAMTKELLQRDYPINFDEIKRRGTKLEIAVTECDKGKLEHHAVRTSSMEKVYPLMQASTAIPWVAAGAVNIDGRLYCDSDVSSSIESSILRAIEQGARKIIAFDIGQPDTLTHLMFQVRIAIYSGRILGINFLDRYSHKKRSKIPLEARVFHLRPGYQWISQHAALDNRAEILKKAYEDGRMAVLGNSKLEKFLSY